MQWLIIVFILIFKNVFIACGGNITENVFNSPYYSENLIISDSLELSITNFILSKIDKINRPANTNSRMRSPDVCVASKNSFAFFWTDSLKNSIHPYDTICRREIKISYTGIDTSSPILKICNTAKHQVNYLHGEKGKTKFLVIFNDSTLTTLKGYGDSPLLGLSRIGAASGNTTRATMCHWRNDTFLVVFQKNDMRLLMRRVYFDNNNFVVQSSTEDTIAQELSGSQDRTISNPSIAADADGNFVVVYLLGLTSVPKKLKCLVFNSNRIKTDSLEFNNYVDSIGFANWYDAAPICSYSKRKFGFVCWDNAGILFVSLRISSSILVDSVRIASNSNFRYPSIHSNEKYITCVWMADSFSTGSSFIKIFGIRDTIINGYIPFTSQAKIQRFSDEWIPSQRIPGKTTNAFALNCAIDSCGNVAVTWPIDSLVYSKIWANLGVRKDSGQWISPVIRYMQSLQDSSYILPSKLFYEHKAFSLSSNDSVKTQIRVGPDSLNQSQWCNWTDASDSLALWSNTRGKNCFLQYKIILYRGIDSLSTPIVKNYNIFWNTKSKIVSLDSVFLRGIKITSLNFDDTLTCFSRKDSVTLYVTVDDPDTSDTLFINISGNGYVINPLDTIKDINKRKNIKILCSPIPKSDTIIPNFFNVNDKRGWKADIKKFYIKTYNFKPQLIVYGLIDTNSDLTKDTVKNIDNRIICIKETDTLRFLYYCLDSNDIYSKLHISKNGSLTDSSGQGVWKTYEFIGKNARPMGDSMYFDFGDPDTNITKKVFVRTNIKPKINYIKAKAKYFYNNDSVSICIGETVSFEIFAVDSNTKYWDFLRYKFKTKSLDTTFSSNHINYTRSLRDSFALIVVLDSLGEKDSVIVNFKNPWLAIDTLINPIFNLSKKYLHDSLSVIIGTKWYDTVEIPIINYGADTLKITSIYFSGSKYSWLRLMIPAKNDTIIYDSLPLGQIDTINIAPFDTCKIYALLRINNLSGDGVAKDTIIFTTNDYSHPADSIFVNLEHNELPRIASITLDFPKDKPYWLAKKSVIEKTEYNFPPHAKILIKFTEPMDTSTAKNSIKAYSIFDSTQIDFSFFWQSNDSVLKLIPQYTKESSYFNGFKPPDGFFIPGDSVKLIIYSTLMDKAKTPHGPNNLDVKMNLSKSASLDTTVIFKVDKIDFTIISVNPKENDTGISINTPIEITFSNPPLLSTIDTTKINNRCLIVTSKYYSGKLINYKNIEFNGSTIKFIPAKSFFYGDTVYCLYRAKWARDSLGYPIDLNKNGIPMSMFDSLSDEDDKIWKFAIKNILCQSVLPLPGEKNALSKTSITIFYTDSIIRELIDTSKINNKTLIVKTGFGGNKTFFFDSISVLGKKAVFYPYRPFFYNDTIFCKYTGLSTQDTSKFFIDISNNKSFFTGDTFIWNFNIKNITLERIEPGEGIEIPISPRISLYFNQPIITGTFDTDTSYNNKSFKIFSTFLKEGKISFKEISFSKDSMQIFIRPSVVFFSKDTITCNFRGFSKIFNYDSIINFPPDDSIYTFGSRLWSYVTKNEGFYTFPNPYKPGKDKRHCSNPATDPCGILFTNLHTLQKGINSVDISILDMNGYPVFSTKSKGEHITFNENDPQKKPIWKWDTKNQRGEYVGSGLYFYLITDLNGKLLNKGKLIIIR
jgi:hypothetical protein